MKYAVLAAAVLIGIPLLGAAAYCFARVRGYLLSLMLFATVLGAHGSINLVSQEWYRGPDRGFEVTVADICCWPLAAALIARFPWRIEWAPRNSVWLLAFFLYVCIGAASAPAPMFAFFSVWKCVRIFAIFWCTVNALRLGVHRSYLWLGYAGAALVVGAMAVEQKYLLGIYRISGPFDHSNTVPMYCNLILPVLLIWALCDKELPVYRAVISIVLCLGLLFAVLCTFSRAGLALSVACLIGGLAWANIRSGAIRVRTATTVLTILMIFAAVRAAVPILDRIRTAPKASAAARDEFNEAAWLILADHPFGIGLNNFSYVLTSQQKYRAHFDAMKNEEQGGVCHHIYWLTAAETGYAGLFLYLIVMVRFTYGALAGSLRQHSIQSTLLFGILLGFCALHAVNFYEWAFRLTPVMQLFAISAGVSVAWAKSLPREQKAWFQTYQLRPVSAAVRAAS